MNRFLSLKLKDFRSSSMGRMDSLLIWYVFSPIFLSNSSLYSFFVRRTLFSWKRSSSYVQISSFSSYFSICFCMILSQRSDQIDLSDKNSVEGRIRDVNSKFDMLDIMLSWEQLVAFVYVVYNLRLGCGGEDGGQMAVSSMGRDLMCYMSPSTRRVFAFNDIFLASIPWRDCLNQAGDVFILVLMLAFTNYLINANQPFSHSIRIQQHITDHPILCSTFIVVIGYRLSVISSLFFL